MARAVKTPPTLRDDQAAQTRRRILDAAAEVFVEQGFAGTRIEDIAERAGVAVPTVYKGFANKRNLLLGALQRAMTGTDSDAPLDQQSWFAEQLAEPDPARQLALIARNSRRLCERAGALLNVARVAAPLDPDIATAWDEIAAQRLTRSRRTVASLIGKAGTRVRLSRDDVAATLRTLTDPELFASYTSGGRSAAQYEAWLADLLRRSILE